MKLLKPLITPVIVAAVAISFSSCKTRKNAAKPQTPEVAAEKPVEEEKKAPDAPATTTTTEKTPADAFAKPNFNFKNIQFEFNSAVLKTFSYEVLDQIASEMKKVPSARFEISGHSSAEGSEEHNRSLSVDRANAVKTYLVNAGIDAVNLDTKGYGESKPIAENKTESGRALNRRVEIKKL